MSELLNELFCLKGQVAVITGGSGVLCSEMARSLGKLGVKVALLGRTKAKLDVVAEEITKEGGTAIGISCDVTEVAQLEKARDEIISKWGTVDILINGAGGNSPAATSSMERLTPEEFDKIGKDDSVKSFFDLDAEGFRFVFELNLLGTLLPCQVFAKIMAKKQSGKIINLSSMAGYSPLTKIPGYSSAKAAIENFTRWLSVHFAPMNIQINAIAPGFFLTDQNRFLLTDKETGEPTDRGRLIINQTPMKRYGSSGELISSLVFLLGPGASFVTGISIPIDGGFNAFGGV